MSTYRSTSSAYKLLRWLNDRGTTHRLAAEAFLTSADGGRLTTSSMKNLMSLMISSGMLTVGWGITAQGRAYLARPPRQRRQEDEGPGCIALSLLDEEGFATSEYLAMQAPQVGQAKMLKALYRLRDRNLISQHLIEITIEGREAIKQTALKEA